MGSPIWDVSGALLSARWDAIEKPGSGRTPGPQNTFRAPVLKSSAQRPGLERRIRLYHACSPAHLIVLYINLNIPYTPLNVRIRLRRAHLRPQALKLLRIALLGMFNFQLLVSVSRVRYPVGIISVDCAYHCIMQYVVKIMPEILD